MMGHLPKVVLKDASGDGYGPTQQRRRPAHACLECHMRKVRCDRKKPCGQCIKTGSEICTYVVRRRAEARSALVERSPAAHPTSAASSDQNDNYNHDYLAQSLPQTSIPTDQFDLTINRYVAPGLLGLHGRSRLQPLPGNRPELTPRSEPELGNSSTIKAMLKKISSLEEQVAVLKSGGDSAAVIQQDANVSDNSDSARVLDASRVQVDKNAGEYDVVKQIKHIEYTTDTSHMPATTIPSEVINSIPSKDVCDLLVECYFRTFEGVFRVLHIPSFRKEYDGYWTGTIPKEPLITYRILLVCAIGVVFHTNCDRVRLRRSCATWIEAAADWLNGPNPQLRWNIPGLQIQLLLILARQVCAIDGKKNWIPAGSLLRTAMYIGLHRDPLRLGIINVCQIEVRRRLWATVLEIEAQSSLDVGMPPMVSAKDYDTRPPSNVDDEDISEGDSLPLDPKPHTKFTGSSVQIALTETLPLRLEIIRTINNLRFDMSYEDVLCHGADLASVCRKNTAMFKSALANQNNITPFQIKMADSLVIRFVLCLHRPYFARAMRDPRYHYSRKMCLDTSLALCSPAMGIEEDQEDDWTRMTHRCVGFFESFFLYAVSTIYYELKSQFGEQRESSSSVAPLVSSSPNDHVLLPVQFDMLYKILKSAHQTAVARLHNGETNPKAAVFLASALARIDALRNGTNVEHAGIEAAKQAVQEAALIIAEIYLQEHGKPINLGSPTVPSRAKDYGSGASSEDLFNENIPTRTTVANNLETTMSDPFFGLNFEFGALNNDLGPLDWQTSQDVTMDNSGGYGNRFDWVTVQQYDSNIWPFSNHSGLDRTGFRRGRDGFGGW